MPDVCDILFGTSLDCNANDGPDECDIAGGFSLDCNENTIPDECDLSSGTSVDLNNNDIPDDCEPCEEGDVNCDGVVNVDDLLLLIGGWGGCQPPLACPADVFPPPSGNGVVNVDDLLHVIGNWG